MWTTLLNKLRLYIFIVDAPGQNECFYPPPHRRKIVKQKLISYNRSQTFDPLCVIYLLYKDVCVYVYM